MHSSLLPPRWREADKSEGSMVLGETRSFVRRDFLVARRWTPSWPPSAALL
ncbi:MAG: hypothetical protein ACXWXF_05305 [Aeromicrobium sp.]